MTADGRRRYASTGSALVVAAIAAYASYSHMRHLALAYGQDAAVATLLPVSVDGMLVVATVALGDGRRRRWSAWLAFWTGVVASVVANVLAAEPSAIARCISAWPAVAFLLVVEVITRGARAGILRVPVPGVFDAVEVHGETRPAVPDTPDAAAVPDPAVTAPADSGPDTDGHADITTDTAADAMADGGRTADKITRLRELHPDMSTTVMAAQLGLSDRTVRRHLAAANHHAHSAAPTT